MGGERETTVPNSAPTVKGGNANIGKVRIHENKGEVHFHDDAANLKVAVPVAIWYEAWQRLQRGPYPAKWSYVDTKNNTSLKVRLKLKDNKLDCKLSVSTVSVTPDFQALQAFTV